MSDNQVGIVPQTGTQTDAVPGHGVPYNLETFAQIRVPEVWTKYADVLSWGKGQTLAILDDGCELTPQWAALLPWGPKVVATWNIVEGGTDATPRPPGYHGTTVGYPSSLNHEGILGIAYNNQVIHIRSFEHIHLKGDESARIAEGLQWVLDHVAQYNITAVNLSPVDDLPHREPVLTAIDEKLAALRAAGIWVSAPCGNNGYTDGISWPACQPGCFAIGATKPGEHAAHLDRYSNVDLLVCAPATSSSNAYVVGSFMILREAMEKAGYDWTGHGVTLPDAVMDIFRQTGVDVFDEATGCAFRELDLLAAVDFVMG